MKKTLAVLAAIAMPAIALAQKPVTDTETLEIKGIIQAIDHTSREITVKGESGNLETLWVGPDVKRFSELKVGDTVKARYTAGLVYQVRKPGTPAPAPASDDVKVTRGTGPRPSGSIAQQQTATVTVKAVDPKVPSITIVTDDNRVLTFQAKDAKRLEGVKAGDKIDVTYTESVVVTVE